jgi:hypothetical protein
MNLLRSLGFGAAAVLCIVVSSALLGRGEEKKPDQVDPRGPASREEPALSSLEKQFAETLSGATLAGRWRVVKDGKLGEEADERYEIRSVQKVGGDLWSISARIQYGGKDLTIPVPVKVYWAGDTPVISITKAGLPGLGTYSARVMIYQGTYTGSWFGTGHGGFLSGTVTKGAATQGSAAKAAAEKGAAEKGTGEKR